MGEEGTRGGREKKKYKKWEEGKSRKINLRAPLREGRRGGRGKAYPLRVHPQSTRNINSANINHFI